MASHIKAINEIVIHWDILLILIQINATVSTHFSQMSALLLLLGSGILPPPPKKEICQIIVPGLIK